MSAWCAVVCFARDNHVVCRHIPLRDHPFGGLWSSCALEGSMLATEQPSWTCCSVWLRSQGYHAHKKPRPREILQYDYA